MMKQRGSHIRFLLIVLGVILVVNILSQQVYHRFDLTQDQRYTLSESAKNTVYDVSSPLVIDVLLEGNFPLEFKRLKAETQQLLEEFKQFNPNVRYQFVNPLDEENNTGIQELISNMGLNGAQVQVNERGKVSTEVVYPWAVAYFNERTVKIPLLKNQLGATSEERVNNSVQNLEYAFADGFGKLTQPKRRKVAVLQGNGQLENRYIADFFTTLREYYFIAPFTLDSVASAPRRTLDQLKEFDLIVAAQPKQAFSDAEKYVLDQYVTHGGASLWLMDATIQRLDTISGNAFAFGNDLNMNDFFFKYGVRINPNLVKDVYAAPIALASGEQSQAQYNQYPWFYYPLSASANNHPIVSNLEAVKFEYASSIDTLPNPIDKTILLSSSPITKIQGLPVALDLDSEIPQNLRVINEGPKPEEFAAGEIPLAVLLEGSFSSVFNNRVKPFSYPGHIDEGAPAKMVVISDGDVIKNQLDRGRPLELGFDKWTNTYYGNKEFLLNTVNYLLDDSGLINIRTKEISVPFLDPQKALEQRTKWQVLNLVLPLALLALFGLSFSYFRRKKCSR